MVDLITKSDFAKLAGVSRAAVSKASTKSLRSSVEGGMIDMDSAAAQRYLLKKGKPIERSDSEKQIKKNSAPEMALRLKIAEKAGLLIRRDLVEDVFSEIRRIFSRLVEDGSKALSIEICKVVGSSKVLAVEDVLSKNFKEVIKELVFEIERNLDA